MNVQFNRFMGIIVIFSEFEKITKLLLGGVVMVNILILLIIFELHFIQKNMKVNMIKNKTRTYIIVSSFFFLEEKEMIE